MPKNHGLILESIRPDTGFLGGPGGELPDIMPSGDWEPFLPVYEKQSRSSAPGEPADIMHDSMNCVQYSRANNCETWANYYGKNINIADRFWYWLTGCTENGNSYSACDYNIRRGGGPAEPRWPWIVPLTRAEYGAEPPGDVKADGLALLDEWTFGQLVWVPTTIEGMRAALKKGPLWACNQYHSFEVYRIDDRIRVFDTYGDAAEGKGSFPLDYAPELVAAYITPFTPKHLVPPPMVQLPANSLVIVVDDGERLMNIDGSKLYKDDAGKILLEVEARNAGLDGLSRPFPIVHVRAADVAGVPRVNLKGESV